MQIAHSREHDWQSARVYRLGGQLDSIRPDVTRSTELKFMTYSFPADYYVLIPDVLACDIRETWQPLTQCQMLSFGALQLATQPIFPFLF